MAEEPPRGQPAFEPLPGWPVPPGAPPGSAPPPSAPTAGAARPPSAPPPGWTGPRPEWATGPGDPPAAPPQPAPAAPGRPGPLHGRRGLAIAGGALALVVLAALVVTVVLRDGDSVTETRQDTAAGGSATAPPAAPGMPLSLLDGRLLVTARPGWELRDTTGNTATVKLELVEPSGRELLTTLVLTALPGGGPIDQSLTVTGGTRFEVKTDTGPLQAVAVPGTVGQITAATVRPPSTYIFSLSVFAFGGVLDVPLLQKLFVEQVVPQLRFT